METTMMGPGSCHVAAQPRPRPSRLLASTSNGYMSNNSVDMVALNWHLYHCCFSKKRSSLRYSWTEYDKRTLGCRWLIHRTHRLPYCKTRRIAHPIPLASSDDSVTVNGNSHASSSSDAELVKIKLTNSLQDQDLSSGIVQSIHDAARAVELAIQEHSSSSRASWFSRAWLGVDKNAWVKTLSYQAAVHSLLQAAIEISSRGDGRDRDTNLFVQRSLSRICAPLENTLREQLSAKQPAAYEWFWADQHPLIVKTFVNLFEAESRFSAATMLCRRGELSSSGSTSDLSLLMLALSCLAAVTKLGSTKISCSQFFSMVPESTGRLMDTLLDFVPIKEAYYSMKDIGLRKEFLFHFGPRAASGISNYSSGVEEISFWVDLIQRQLQRAIDREKIWSRLTTCESIEVLEKDLAIFGFFIALGRSTKSFLSSNGLTVTDESIESFIRYLIGGTVLYYPQLSSISSYQLYVEVVCEELEWLPFYQSKSVSMKQKNDTMDMQDGIPAGETIPQVLEVCFYWMTSFIKYSTWLENPSNIKAAKFLSRGHSKLIECMDELGVNKKARNETIMEQEGQLGSGTYTSSEADLDSFDKALENVEEALNRLEDLLQELHLSNSKSGKEHLKAACSDLERIRRLKKEAEFLEASFRAKATSLQQDVADEIPTSPNSEQKQFSRKKSWKTSEKEIDRKLADRVNNEPHAFWSFLVQNSTKKTEGSSIADENAAIAKKRSKDDSEVNEIRRFELLRNELMELEKRVQRSTEDAQNEEESELMEGEENHASIATKYALVKADQKDSIISKSFDKIRQTSTDVWQGTQLLAIDTAAAMALLKRTLTGDELTEKEKKALRRTVTDLASVVPIGFLMLLPVTAVGHAAMLAAIQRYVPSLIPSTYGPERLGLLRQLEKVKAMEATEMNADETTEENSLSSTNAENL